MLDISHIFEMLDISNIFEILDISNRFKILEVLDRFQIWEIKKKLVVIERLGWEMVHKDGYDLQKTIQRWPNLDFSAFRMGISQVCKVFSFPC